ncbi:low molecular weight protein-tyrosine-phosphatase [Citricoccus sp.]|uniref:low molecular weight protein-tyrosine-phosphatase n=1 Tax=Citricoccus sp. TaxID=1978372 RepID=UPI002C73E98C|nr:low molecular weight protein-tyrosine-phosphatase [Citricoccus sp.]HRO95385.1 low molecular weight protein-tyrosine-phosphatase [Citricoccus sp.]
MHLMTVCLGNICRSPAAEAVLVHRLREAGLDDVTVSSAGTSDYHLGEPPHVMSSTEGEARGYAFTSVGAQFAVEDFDTADLILVMDAANDRDVRALARGADDERKVVRLGAFARDVAGRGVRDVPDPYGLPESAFVSMYDQIEDAVDGLVRSLRDGTLQQVLDTRCAGSIRSGHRPV